MQYRDPCFKKDADTNKANYCPISILLLCPKCPRELCINDKVHYGIRSHLSLNTSAFLKHHFCCSALMKISEDWRRFLDNREAAAAVAIGLSKAFDSIYQILLLA